MSDSIPPLSHAPGSATEVPLRKRYLSKVTAGGVGLGASLIGQVLITRSLGPVNMGNFSFLSNFFSQAIDFFDAGASLCFYNRLSQRRDSGLIRFNWEYLGWIGVAVSVGVGVVILGGWTNRLWPDQRLSWVWSVFFLAFLLKITTTAGQIIDAFGHTIDGERARTVQRGLALLLLVVLCWGRAIGLPIFLGYNAVAAVLLLGAWHHVLRKRNIQLFPTDFLAANVRRAYAQEYWTYSHPLVVYSLAGFVANVLDRWFLQTYAGSMDQGFFGFSFQWSSVCFLFSGAMTPLIMREFALAFERNDPDSIRWHFERYVPLLYSVTGFLAAFMAVESRVVAGLAGGPHFVGAAGPLAVMAFYPLHQMLGQVCGSYFYATGKTTVYRNVGILSFLVGLMGTYFFLAPPSRGGLGGGALGLAAKTVLFNVLSTNALLWVMARSLNMRFGHFLWQQAWVALFWTTLAALCGFPAARWVPSPVLALGSTALLYGGAALAAVALRPTWVGVSKEDAQRILSWVRERLRPRAASR